ncbi:MAG: Rne/Rng family ribonuclease [Gammaproteobacteria bacterium]|nr:Rne/Rng family ribonuclease [Gammaproteobacteria bacterium]
MGMILINTRWPEELRIATIAQNKLIDIEIDYANNDRLKGNIYNARILKIETSLNAVFVDYGENRNGFLPFKEINSDYLKRNEEGKYDPSSLSIGQTLLVQVEKDERGEKGAALTTYLSVAGTYLVYMPYSNKSTAISKQADQKERSEMKQILSDLNIPEGVGVIVRTAGIGKNFNDIQWDYQALENHWKHVKEASENHPTPFLIHQESDTLTRVLRDNLKQETEKIIIDSQEGFDGVKRFLNIARPGLTDKLELHEDAKPLFDAHGIEDQIKTIFNRQVKLPSGGAIIIDTTEALTAIDVNSAKSTKGDDIESTALHTNMEAIDVLSTQLRLRDIGGIVVIDFIDMLDKKNRIKVEEHAKKKLYCDRAKIKIESISPLTGCLSLLRQRLKSSNHTVMTVKSECQLENYCFLLMRIVESTAADSLTTIIQLQTSVNVGTYLLNECRDIIQRIQNEYQTDIQIIPNSNFDMEKHELKVVKSANRIQGHSYEQKQMANVDLESRNRKRYQQPAAVQRDLYKKPAPSESGLVSRLFKNLFKKDDEKKDADKKQHHARKHNQHKNHSRNRNMQNRRRKQNYNKQRTQTEK